MLSSLSFSSYYPRLLYDCEYTDLLEDTVARNMNGVRGRVGGGEPQKDNCIRLPVLTGFWGK